MSKTFISVTFKGVKSDPPAKSDRKPIDNLSDRNKADPKTKPTESAQTRNEVQQSHLWWSFKLWSTDCKVIMPKMSTHQTPWDPQKRGSRWQYPCCRRCRVTCPSISLSKLWISNLLNDLDKWSYELLLVHGVWVLAPQRSWHLLDIGGRLVSVSLQDAWLPHCKGGGR